MRKTILVIDDSIINLSTVKSAFQDEYDVLTAPSARKAADLMEHIRPDLILLDIEMPETDGYETLKRLKSSNRTASVPVIYLTARNDLQDELYGLSLGAVDYISKPFSAPLLKKRVEIHLLIEEQKQRLCEYNENLKRLVDEKTRKITVLQDAILSSMAELMEFRDDATGGHIERTQLYLKALADRIRGYGIYTEECAAWDMELLIKSAQLHDVGKICIADDILKKPARLTYEEYNILKTHTTLGKEAIERISLKAGESEFLRQAAIMAHSHHERWDGSGYPLGLSGVYIPIQGRLMAVADVYDALVSARPYKQPLSHREAVHIIKEGAGRQFDPLLVNLFSEAADEFDDISRHVRS